MEIFSIENQERLRSLAIVLRSKHGAMEWGVSPVYIINKEGLDYDEYSIWDRSIIKAITKPLVKIARKIRAVLSVSEKVVLIDRTLHSAKKPFGQAHELGHHYIPEHKAILYECSENDLHPQVRKEMEFEANVFASEFLFPDPLMDNIYKNYPLSMETILALSKYSNASIHSSAIGYVSHCDQPCCLLVLDKEEDEQGNCGLKLRHQLWSPAWGDRFKQKIIADRQFFSPAHNLSRVAFSELPENIVKNTLSLRKSEIMFQMETFFNGYIVLALLYNPCSSSKSRT